jgi:hypothetical protein
LDEVTVLSGCDVLSDQGVIGQAELSFEGDDHLIALIGFEILQQLDAELAFLFW